jgi:hypothetical protein
MARKKLKPKEITPGIDLMKRTFRIEKHIAMDFRQWCQGRGLTCERAVEALMLETVRQNDPAGMGDLLAKAAAFKGL